VEKAAAAERMVLVAQPDDTAHQLEKHLALAIEIQCSQLRSLSWQYALLLPYCVWLSSSPPRIIGTPCDRRRVARKLHFWRSRSARTSGSSVGPPHRSSS